MIVTSHIVAALAFFRTFGLLHAGQSFPESNPDMGVYQDEANCFPLSGTWYIIYRSFENDPYFGGSPKCIAVYENGPFENGSGGITVEVGGTQKVNATATLVSSPGYSAKNVINAVVDGPPEVSFNVTSVYTDCGSCKVLRHSYADGGQGCSLWQPESAIGQNITCCHFIYDLLCNTSTKYDIHGKCSQGR
ncbi:uncharacterized protein LOC144146861 [Haemaphysalis longicornis]